MNAPASTFRPDRHPDRRIHPTGASLLAAAGLLLAVACAPSEDGAAGSATSTTTADAPDPATRKKGTAESPNYLDTGVDLSALDKASKKISSEAVSYGAEAPEPGGAELANNVEIRLLEGDRSHNFGDVLQGRKATHTFRLEVAGEDDLVLSRLKPSCGCTLADMVLLADDGERSVYTVGEAIPPGTKFEIEASLKTDGRSGEMSSNIALYSNVPEGVMHLNLKANVTPILVVEPENILNFSRITTADVVDGEMRIKSDILEPFKLSLDEQFLVEPLQVALEPVAPNEEGKSTEWLAKITLGPKCPEGMRNYPILFKSDVPVPDPKTPGKDGEVPTYEVRSFVQAQVTGLVSATPNFVSFGMVRPGQETERFVLIRAHDDYVIPADVPVRIEGLRGDEFQYPDAISYSVEPAEEDKNIKLTIKLLGLPDDLNGSFGGIVKIDVGHPDKEQLDVRFSGVCRQGLPPQATPNTQQGAQSPADHNHDHDH